MVGVRLVSVAVVAFLVSAHSREVSNEGCSLRLVHAAVKLDGEAGNASTEEMLVIALGADLYAGYYLRDSSLSLVWSGGVAFESAGSGKVEIRRAIERSHAIGVKASWGISRGQERVESECVYDGCSYENGVYSLQYRVLFEDAVVRIVETPRLYTAQSDLDAFLQQWTGNPTARLSEDGVGVFSREFLVTGLSSTESVQLEWIRNRGTVTHTDGFVKERLGEESSVEEGEAMRLTVKGGVAAIHQFVLL